MSCGGWINLVSCRGWIVVLKLWAGLLAILQIGCQRQMRTQPGVIPAYGRLYLKISANFSEIVGKCIPGVFHAPRGGSAEFDEQPRIRQVGVVYLRYRIHQKLPEVSRNLQQKQRYNSGGFGEGSSTKIQ